jgi:glycosyltransferase involved in cell wall biosynthesis
MAHWTLRHGGAQAIMCRLSEHLRRRGHKVDFLTTLEPGLSPPEMLEACDCRWHCARLPYETARVYLPRLARAIEAGNYDVFVTHHSIEAVSATGYLPTSIAAVSIVHDDPIRGHGHVALSNPDAFDVFVGVSETVACAARSLLGELRRVVCIRNGVTVPSIDTRERTGFLRAVFVGRLEDAQKGCLLLPGILRELKSRGVPIHLTVVGDGPDGARLERAFRDLGVADHVTMRGALSQPEAQAAIALSDVLLSCSRHEGLPLVVLEAMVRGCVPVVPAIAPMREVVTHEQDGWLVEDRSARGFADALSELSAGPVRLAGMATRARETAASHFGEQGMCEAYEELFLQVAALPGNCSRLQRASSLFDAAS